MADKKLRKSRDKKVAGVCGGVAEYFGIDPTAIRLIWALAILFYGSGLLLYILMAIIMPEPLEEGKAQDASSEDEEIVVEVADASEDAQEKK